MPNFIIPYITHHVGSERVQEQSRGSALVRLEPIEAGICRLSIDRSLFLSFSLSLSLSVLQAGGGGGR